MKILAPIKLKEENPAIPTAISLACKLGAELRFLHVVDISPLRRSFLKEPPSMKEYLRREGGELLEWAKKRAKECGVKTSTLLIEGVPHEVILKEAKNYDLVVMRSRVYSAEGKLGRVVGGVLDRIEKPLMLVNKEQKSFETCLIPVDGSEESFKALYHLKKWKEKYKLKKIYIVNVHSTLRDEKGEEYHHMITMDTARELANGCAEKIVVEVLHLQESVPEAILHYASEKKVDMIFMGMHGTGLSKLILGSVSVEVASKAEVPVVLFPKAYIP